MQAVLTDVDPVALANQFNFVVVAQTRAVHEVKFAPAIHEGTSCEAGSRDVFLPDQFDRLPTFRYGAMYYGCVNARTFERVSAPEPSGRSAIARPIFPTVLGLAAQLMRDGFRWSAKRQAAQDRALGASFSDHLAPLHAYYDSEKVKTKCAPG